MERETRKENKKEKEDENQLVKALWAFVHSFQKVQKLVNSLVGALWAIAMILTAMFIVIVSLIAVV